MVNLIKEICENVRKHPLSDNAIDYVEEELLRRNSLGEDIFDILERLSALGYTKSFFDMTTEEMNKWDRAYDAECHNILCSKKKP